MHVKQLFADEDAVSPVIGVILMVAITVILAAVIGTFVLGLGENVQDSAPQANFQFEYQNTSDSDTINDAVKITHTGGEDVAASTASITVNGTTIEDVTSNNNLTSTWSDPISTGDTLRLGEENVTGVTANPVEFSGGDTVRVIWTSESGGTSNTIGQSTVPS